MTFCNLHRIKETGCRLGCFFVCMTFVTGLLGNHSGADPQRVMAASADPTAIETNEVWQELSDTLYAQAAVLLDADSGRVLFEKNGETFLPVASTTKIMTCILALEYGCEEDLCTVSSYAASQPAVHLGVQTGQQFQLRDLLYAMMLESDNDAAVVVAEHISGSAEAFAELMNQKAKELGMENTWFVTANGLDQDGNGSTAYDMALLSAYAIQNDRFLQIIDTESWSFADASGTHHYTVTNHDAFLNQMEGALGIKTGYTGAAGYCFAGALYRNGKRLVAVVLATGWPPNKNRKWSDVRHLMEYGLEAFDIRTVLAAEPELTEIPVTEGRKGSVTVGFTEEISLLLHEREQIQVQYRYPGSLQAPVAPEKPVGEALIFLNGIYLESVPICTRTGDMRKTYSDYLQQVLSLFGV